MRQVLETCRQEMMGGWSGEADRRAEWTDGKDLKGGLVGQKGVREESKVGAVGGWWGHL